MHKVCTRCTRESPKKNKENKLEMIKAQTKRDGLPNNFLANLDEMAQVILQRTMDFTTSKK